ncbi:MAG: hypothetical protein RL266_2068 [Bacteroidota bacterium]|jgi:hypothetical protein
MLRLSVLFFLFAPLFGWSQTDLLGDEKVTKTDQEVYAEGAKEEAKILIIPFEEKLFYCDIMRDLTEANQMTQQQIYDRLRNEIQLSLKAALKDSMETATFLNTDSITDQDLINIYAVLGYKYVPVPVKEEVDEKGKVNSDSHRKEKKQPEPKMEVGIRNGQVVAERQVVDRYMSAQLKSFDVLQQLNANYGINKFLFINQMDVKMDLTDPETAFLDPKRMVAIHYTIMDKEGKEISGGLASSQFPGTESRFNYIIGSTFYKLSAEVLGSLIKAEQKEKEAGEVKDKRSKTKASE